MPENGILLFIPSYVTVCAAGSSCQELKGIFIYFSQYTILVAFILFGVFSFQNPSDPLEAT